MNWLIGILNGIIVVVMVSMLVYGITSNITKKKK